MSPKNVSPRGYQLTNMQIANFLNIKGKPITKTTTVSRLRKEGLPDTDNASLIFTFDFDRKVKKVEKILNSRSHKARELGISVNKYRYYQRQGMPDKVEKAQDWIKQRNKKVSYAEIGRALGKTRERIRQLVQMGMPFNVTDNPIGDAVTWYYEWQKINAEIKSNGFLLDGTITQKKLCEELSLTRLKLMQFMDEGMPSDNIPDALEWLRDNKIKVGKHWKDNDENGFRLWFRHQFNAKQSMYNQCIKAGMPKGIEEATDWMHKNAFKHNDIWRLNNAKSIKEMMCESLRITPYQYDKFTEGGMAKDSVMEAAGWIYERFIRTEFGLIAR